MLESALLYASGSEYNRVLNMLLVLNMAGFWISQGCEHASSPKYVRVLNIPFPKYKKNFFLRKYKKIPFPEN